MKSCVPRMYFTRETIVNLTSRMPYLHTLAPAALQKELRRVGVSASLGVDLTKALELAPEKPPRTFCPANL